MAWITDENNNLVEIPSKTKKETIHLEPIIINCRKTVDIPLRVMIGNLIIKLGHFIKGS